MTLLYFFLAQADAITPTGALSANWVLIGITTIAFILFGRTLGKIERNLEKVISSISDHHTRIELNTKAIEDLETDVLELNKEQKRKR